MANIKNGNHKKKDVISRNFDDYLTALNPPTQLFISEL